MAYLYRHIRLDTNEPFYIGIGSDEDGKYERSRASWGRNKIWKRIVNKVSYRVDIIQDNLTWDEACTKEIEFIKLYGRRDLGLGPLVNLTDGGDGLVGYKRSEKLNKDALLYKAIPVFQYDLDGNFIKEWNSSAQASNELNLDRGHVCAVLKNKKLTVKGFIFKYEKFDKIEPPLLIRNHPISQYSKENIFIKKWNSMVEAQKTLNINNISKVLNNKAKFAGGFRWKRNLHE